MGNLNFLKIAFLVQNKNSIGFYKIITINPKDNNPKHTESCNKYKTQQNRHCNKYTLQHKTSKHYHTKHHIETSNVNKWKMLQRECIFDWNAAEKGFYSQFDETAWYVAFYDDFLWMTLEFLFKCSFLWIFLFDFLRKKFILNWVNLLKL